MSLDVLWVVGITIAVLILADRTFLGDFLFAPGAALATAA